MKKSSYLSLCFSINLRSNNVNITTPLKSNPMNVNYSKSQLIETTYADPTKEIYKNLYIQPSTTVLDIISVTIKAQNNLDNLKADNHLQIQKHANELDFIEQQLAETNFILQEKLPIDQKKDFEIKLNQLNKQKKLMLKILVKQQKQEKNITKRQQELYDLDKFMYKYAEKRTINNENIKCKIKANQKIYSKDIKEIIEIVSHYPGLIILTKPSYNIRPNWCNQQGAIIDASEIKNYNNYEKHLEYITNQYNIYLAKNSIQTRINEIRNKIDQMKTPFHSQLEKQDKTDLKNQKKILELELNHTQKQLKILKKREKELKRVGNFSFKYDTSYNGSLPSQIRSNFYLDEIVISQLSKILAKYMNLNLLIQT